MTFICLTCSRLYCILSPGITVSAEQAGLQLGEGQAELGLKSDRVLD